MSTVPETIIRAQRKPKQFLIAQIISAIISISLSIYFVLIINLGVLGALTAALIGMIIKTIIVSYSIKEYVVLNQFNYNITKLLLSYGLPYVPHRIQTQIVSLFSLFMVNQYLGIAVAGVYSVVNKFTKPIWLFVSSIQKAWVPYKFHVHKNDVNPGKTFNFLISNYWITLIYIWAISSFLFPWIFKSIVNSRYHIGMMYFPFLAFVPLAQAFYFTVQTGLELGKSQKILPKCSFIGMITVIFITVLSIKSSGPYGTIISQSVAFIIMGIISFKYAIRYITIAFPFNSISLNLLINILFVYMFYNNINKYVLGLCILLSTINYLIFIKIINKHK